jgi:hypothetical protein
MPSPTIADELIHLKVNAAQLSAEQERFNKLIERVASLTRQTETHRGWAERYIPLRTNTIGPLRKQRDALKRAMVLFLHQRLGGADLGGADLGAAQRRMASRLVCSMSASFAAQGDAEMQILHDAYSEQSFAQNQSAAATVTLAMLEEHYGIDLDLINTQGSPDEVLRAAMQHLRERDAAEQAQRAARKAKRPKTARQEEAHLKDQDANSALKTIYRQLASALHPDREADPEARKHKTALMGEANAAYERRDLLALLQLQLRIEQVDSESIGRMAHSRLVALSRLLSEQSKALSQDLLRLQLRLFDAFSLHHGTRVSEARIVGSIEEERQALQAAIDQMEADTRRVQDPAQLKRWLKEQQSRFNEAD